MGQGATWLYWHLDWAKTIPSSQSVSSWRNFPKKCAVLSFFHALRLWHYICFPQQKQSWRFWLLIIMIALLVLNDKDVKIIQWFIILMYTKSINQTSMFGLINQKHSSNKAALTQYIRRAKASNLKTIDSKYLVQVNGDREKCYMETKLDYITRW